MATDFGTDLSCVTDLTSEMAEVSGRIGLAQAIARRWSTPRGQLCDDPNYGYDLAGYLNDDVTSANIAQMQTGAQNEALKDQRVLSASVTISLAGEGVLIVTGIFKDAAGPFTLVLSVTSVTITILSVT